MVTRLKTWLGPQNFGRLLFLKNIMDQKVPKTPLNGQKIRTEIFLRILSARRWGRIIETGSFLGATTNFFSKTGLPVITIETNPEYHAYTQLRFLFQKKVTVLSGDSRKVLAALAIEKRLTEEPCFFYLDAHWGAELPLLEEIRTIFRNFSSPVVMIDDFYVPGTRYGYDDYGKGRVLDLEHLRPVIREFHLAAYFPKAPAELETGAKRGTVFLFPPEWGPVLPGALGELLQRAELPG